MNIENLYNFANSEKRSVISASRCIEMSHNDELHGRCYDRPSPTPEGGVSISLVNTHPPTVHEAPADRSGATIEFLYLPNGAKCAQVSNNSSTTPYRSFDLKSHI
eukprot:COSAG02_NODE_673_length_18630_cov_7.960768_8_plen_105_part_00